jgi:hypothetical protein
MSLQIFPSRGRSILLETATHCPDVPAEVMGLGEGVVCQLVGWIGGTSPL